MNTDTLTTGCKRFSGVTPPRSARSIASLYGAIAVLCLAAGCTTLPRPSPVAPDDCWADQEQIGERIRPYPSITETQALGAAAKLLQFSGHDNSKMARAAHSITSEFQKSQTIYLERLT